MRYKCLVFDHDDTVVNSTASIHYPCFVEFLREYYPDRTCTLEEYFRFNFAPGFVETCRDVYGMDRATIDYEVEYWRRYVEKHVPLVYDGIRGIMERHKAEGGIICVVSHSLEEYIIRDYEHNGLPMPDAVYGWNRPPEERKPEAFPLEDIMQCFSLQNKDLLMIDDLKAGYEMAKSCGTDFAAVGWSNNIFEIESFMRSNCPYYFKTVAELKDFLA